MEDDYLLLCNEVVHVPLLACLTRLRLGVSHCFPPLQISIRIMASADGGAYR